MKNLGVKLFLFLILLLCGMFVLDAIYKKTIPKNIAEKTYWIFNQKPQTYNYIVLGSSRAESSFDCVYFDSITNSKGINLAINGAGLIENELILRKFLQKNSTQVLFLELDEANLSPINHLSYPFHEYLYLPYLDDTLIARFVKQEDKNHHYYLWKYIPFVKYAEFNAKFSINKLIQHEKIDTMIDYKGYRAFINHQPEYTFKDWQGHFTDKRYWYVADYSTPQKEYEKIDEKSVQSIQNIIALCKEKNIQLVFYCAPSFESHYTKYKYNAYHKFDFIESLSSTNKIPFINFANWKYNAVDSFYYDYSHLNSVGARQMSFIMASYYINNFKLDNFSSIYFQDSILTK